MALLHKSSVRTQWNGLRTSLVRNPFISPEIIDPKFVINMPVDAIASSRLIDATTPKNIRKNIHKTCKPKARYHVRNWAAYK
ncbi:MAG: hypothetical protein E5299_00459 [Burkholderia gladioli]|nr:MAG: hypothetical protein E5299_00459 [Burkholderia gladioli]